MLFVGDAGGDIEGVVGLTRWDDEGGDETAVDDTDWGTASSD